MNIYIDFEATQFGEHIIAIGADCDFGSFECLVKPPKGDKVNAFITNLTGITKEMSKNGLNIEEAFSDFWQWCCQMQEESSEPIFFHCYGDSDKNFLKKTISYIEDFSIREFVSNLSESLIDDSKKVCRLFHVDGIGLFKALHRFLPDYGEQDHDPLNDAIALNYLMKCVSAFPIPEEDKKSKKKKKKENRYIVTGTHATDPKAKPKTFHSFDSAEQWIYKKIKEKSPDVSFANVQKRLEKAIAEGTVYQHRIWTAQPVK